jgi:hypothetical protein
MPDDTPTPESDARDERVADLLAVEPLDEVTRRRLVRTALEESVPRSSRFANVAAILVAVLIGGGVGAVLVNGPDDNPPVATEAAAPTEAAPELHSADQGEALKSATTFAPVEALGDLGDVSTRAALREAVTGAFERAAGAAAAPGAALAYPCVTTPPDQLGLVAVVAAGLATYESLPVSVVVGTSPAGDSLALVLAAAPGCEVLTSVELPRS